MHVGRSPGRAAERPLHPRAGARLGRRRSSLSAFAQPGIVGRARRAMAESDGLATGTKTVRSSARARGDDVLARAHDDDAHRGAGGRDSASGLAPRSRSVELDAEEAEPRADRGAHERRALADAAGEDERVEPAERDRHRGDRRRDAVARRPRARAARRAPRDASSSSTLRRAAEAEQAGLVLERVLELVRRRSRRAAAGRGALRGRPSPERVAIGTPSSGLKPIVVSTERPSSTAVTEQPPPRWQTTRRGDGHLLGRPLRPRGRGSRSGGSPTPRASAAAPRRSRASGGIVAWKAVSKTATCGTSGQRRRASSIAAERRRVVQRRELRRAPRARGATPSSISTGSRKRAPPWTTRCATASTSRGASLERRRPARRARPSSTTRELRLVEPALTTRTSHAQYGQVQSRISGIVLAVLARVRAGARAARRPSPGAGAPRGRRARARGRSRRSRGGSGRGR